MMIMIMMRLRSSLPMYNMALLVLVLLLLLSSCQQCSSATADQTTTTTTTTQDDTNMYIPSLSCSITSDPRPDPNLKTLTYDIGDGPQTMQAYVTPPVTSFYQLSQASSSSPSSTTTAVPPNHKGLAAKFINMSNQTVRLFWIPSLTSMTRRSLLKVIGPFSSSGTASFPGHHFYISPKDHPDQVLHRWQVGNYPDNIYYYDPYLVPDDELATQHRLQTLLSSDSDHALYAGWNRTRVFNEIYRNFTGRSYLANYLRAKPKHFQWPADYFGQQHWITTAETHFTTVPPSELLGAIEAQGTARILRPGQQEYYQQQPHHQHQQQQHQQQHRLLSNYRSSTPLNLTLTVLSCAPRVFSIENFLSPAEVAHIMNIAAGMDLHESLIGEKQGDIMLMTNQSGDAAAAAAGSSSSSIPKVRTSFNSWMSREQTPIVDAIYRRAADLLRIDEALLRQRPDGERADDMPTQHSIAEPLQLVHYDLHQEYTAHHDYGYNDIAQEYQPERFATLIMYLNDAMEGGETAFPRWINAETADQLKVTPKVGNAALFYGILPDGNMDDFSQHAALPVTKGEKWMTNLWVWDPHFKDDFWFY